MMNEIPKAFYSTTLETSSLILEKISTLLYKIINLTTACQDREICDALRDLVPFVQFKKNTHGGVLLLVKLQAKILQLY